MATAQPEALARKTVCTEEKKFLAVRMWIIPKGTHLHICGGLGASSMQSPDVVLRKFIAFTAVESPDFAVAA
jgi:hypothetical protein